MAPGSSNKKRWLHTGAALCLPVATLLSGCQSVQGSSPRTLIRVIDASANAKAVDVSVANTLIAVNTAAPGIGSYAAFPPEKATISVYPTGTKKASASVSGTFQVGQQHSVLLTDAGAGYTATLLTDQITPPPAGDISLRFLQEASATGAVDIYLLPAGTELADAKPLLSNVAAGTVTDYLNVAAGTFTLVITPTGSVKPTYTGTAVALTGGQVRTLLIVDAQLTTNPPVTVVAGNDLN